MVYLFFDTETTGLTKKYDAPSSDLDNWSCRLVQLSWIMKDENQTLLSQGDFIIKPEGFEIPKESSNVHGITTEIALLLTTTNKPLKEIALQLGFSSQAHLSRYFKKQKGVSPSEYKHS